VCSSDLISLVAVYHEVPGANPNTALVIMEVIRCGYLLQLRNKVYLPEVPGANPNTALVMHHGGHQVRGGVLSSVGSM